MELNTVYLLTGSNIGDSKAYLSEALEAIQHKLGAVIKRSSLYKTAPWGNTDQQDFYNQVLCLETNLDARAVLQTTLGIEQEMGRQRHEKWAPRTIDIDLLFFNNEVINEPDLVIPHPLLHKRRFTLAPLNEIAPGLIHPLLQQSISRLLRDCGDSSVVEKL